MPQVSKIPLRKEIWEKAFGLFLEGLVEAKDKRVAKVFVESFFTPTERIMFTKRFAIFFLLEKGTKREEIASLLKVSTATVSRLGIWWRGLSSESKRLLRRLMLKKEIKNLFVDTLKSLYYGPFPPKGRDWKRWGREKWRWEREKKEPLR